MIDICWMKSRPILRNWKTAVLNLYHGNYSAYTTERELRRLRQQQMYAAQQKEIARIEAAIARFELWASIVVDKRHINQARSRRKMLDKMDKVEKGDRTTAHVT